MVDERTLLALFVLKELEGLEGSSTSYELVGEFSLTGLLVTVDLVVSIFGVIYKKILLASQS